MTSSAALTELRTGPLYFFDQPTKPNRRKGSQSFLYLNVASEGAQMNDTTQRDNDNREGEELTQRLSGETYEDGKPDTPPAALSIKEHDVMDAYRRAAPHLLNELARLLSQHKWSEKGCIPRGIVNILNYSWQDLTAGVVYLNSQEQSNKRSKGSLKLGETQTSDRRDPGERGSCVVEKVTSKPPTKKCKGSESRAHNSSTISFSLTSDSCKHPRWIIRPKRPSCDEPQWINLCQWAVERLRLARNPETPQTADKDRDIILLHYGDARSKVRHGGVRREAVSEVTRRPGATGVKQKLHHRINDGSSFIYYPSGCVAVCQSHSGLPCGGFYTNVFSDSECPVILATVTACGLGAVTHPQSSAVTAVWDQDGGFMCDDHGIIMKEWSWRARSTRREKILIQLSDMISVKLLNGTFALLCFRCNNESVQLPLSALSVIKQSKETVSACSRGVLQMVREVDGLEELSARRRRGGHVARELRRLQQRVRNIAAGWLEYYRLALGIRYPDTERMPDAPLRTRRRRKEQSAALPPLNPPEQADVRPVRLEEDRSDLQEINRCVSAPAERPLDSCIKLLRSPSKRSKEPRVTQIGPLQIHGHIKPESVIIPNSPDLHPSAIPRAPAPPPSALVTVCPALLRAALQEEGGRRRCCCSATLMPVLTDVEYDAFVVGQPPHSQQILVVCVTQPHQPVSTQAESDQDVLERLYRTMNKHRTTPCTQCQMDSFRLVRYEMSTGEPSCREENILLQRRHNAAPGMVLMYVRGKLLFVGYVFIGHPRADRDLQKQISRSRGDYRLGLSLPSDYKFSGAVNPPAATDAHNSQDAALKRGDGTTLTALAQNESTNEREDNEVPEVSHRQRDFCSKLKKTPVLPVLPVITL